MHRLPTLESGGACWSLPLADRTALRLADAWLSEDPDRQRVGLELALRDDPALALWTVCVAHRCGASDLPSVAALASWLWRHGGAVLRWPAEPPLSAAHELRREWAEAARRGVAAARLAEQSAAEGAGGDAQFAGRAYHLGLLHNAQQWLEWGCTTSVALEQHAWRRLLPAALSGPLDELTGAAPAGPLAALVADAVRRASSDASADAADAAQLDYARRVQRDWMRSAGQSEHAAVAGASGLLPRLMDRLARWRQLEDQFDTALEQAKLAAMKELAYGASHEINNPLANISSRAQTLLREEQDPERRRKLATINSQAFRAHEMISDLMLFAKPPPLQRESIKVAALLEEVAGELSGEVQQRGAELQWLTADPDLAVTADRTQLGAAIRAMCLNALEAIGVGGRIEMLAGRVEAPAGLSPLPHWLAITIQDDGPGVPAEARRHLFEPYYSGREAGRGLGLGLSKCWRIVSEHGGRIDLDSSERRGAKFTILLPSART